MAHGIQQRDIPARIFATAFVGVLHKPATLAKPGAIGIRYSVLWLGGKPIYIWLMLGTTATDFLLGLLIDSRRRQARLWVAISLILNLGALFTFKYLDFSIRSLNNIPGLEGLRAVGLRLSIGISFYTFQKVSYIIDIYRGNCQVQRNAVDFSVYVTLFPQLIAGPIVKYRDVAEQLSSRAESFDGFADGVRVFVIGLSKKVLLANMIGQLYEACVGANPVALTCAGAWLGTIAFAFQIYFDFSGYSDMAIGLGRMFGFEFQQNFNYPYTAKSISDFWRRWHISLTTWFREYMYIPLGGNRVGKVRGLINILLVWLATGLWHGASWNFIIWGLYYAVFIILEKLFGLRLLKRVPSAVRTVYVLVLTLLGWAIFSQESLSGIANVLQAMFGYGIAPMDGADIYHLRSYAIPLLLLAIASTPLPAMLFRKLPVRLSAILDIALIALGLVFCTAAIVDSSYNPFMYFRF